MRMLRWSGGNCKESPGKEVEVVWPCDECHVFEGLL